MTPARIKELRDYITGNGTPRDWVPMESKELLELLRMAELAPSFQRIGKIDSYICLERTWLHHSPIAEDNKIVWKCRCAAPQNFEAVGDTVLEVVTKAVELHDEITTK